jgi:cytoskeletal protein RodZ
MALCVIVGLAAGFAAGFYVQRELKSRSKAPKASESSKTAKEESSAPASTAPAASSAPAATSPPAPLITGSTPAEAMQKYIESQGESSSGMSYSVVSVSKTDDDWKIDKAARSGGSSYYFVLHYTGGRWNVVDFGTGFNAERLAADGAPADLLTSAVPRSN